MDEKVMTEKQASDYLQLTTRTLQAWRYRGGGPKYIRVSSKCVRYRQSDIDKWLASRIASSTSEETEIENVAQ